MNKNQLESALALERCRIYTAHIAALNHFSDNVQELTSHENNIKNEISITGLIKNLQRDLDILSLFLCDCAKSTEE